MQKRYVRHGLILILLALVTGLLVPSMTIPRLGLSAHTIGLLSGALLIGLGAVWPLFVLSTRQAAIMLWAWLYAGYVNWLGCLVGAALGAGRTTPLAADGFVGGAMAEALVGLLLVSVAIASFIAVALSLWGLRGSAARPA